MKFLAALLTVVFLSACATNSGNPSTDARGRATNAALAEAGKALGSIAVDILFNVAKQEATGNKIDFASAASSGLWRNAGSIVSSNSVRNIVQAYSGERLPKTAQTAANVFSSSVGSNAQAINAIASVISAAAGAPPAK